MKLDQSDMEALRAEFVSKEGLQKELSLVTQILLILFKKFNGEATRDETRAALATLRKLNTEEGEHASK